MEGVKLLVIERIGLQLTTRERAEIGEKNEKYLGKRFQKTDGQGMCIYLTLCLTYS